MIHIPKFNLKISVHVGIILFLFVAGCQKDLSAPEDYNIICYAAAYGKGVYRSDNGGTSWFPVDVDQIVIYAYFKRLYLDTNNKNMLYVATTGAGLFTLNLKDKYIKNVEQFVDENVRSVSFSLDVSGLKEKREVMVGMNGGGVFKAIDIYGPWQPFNNGLTYRDVNILLTRGEDLFAGTTKDMFKRDATSRQWVAISEGIKNKNIISIDSDPQGKIIYAGAGPYEGEKGFFEDIPCLYKSTDQGRTWVASDNGIPDGTLIYIICVNPKKPERIYLGTSDGIYRSTNNGKIWEKMENGLPMDLRAFDMKIGSMPDGKDVVYAAGSKGVFMTIDDDKTLWTNKSYGLEQTAITSIILLDSE